MAVPRPTRLSFVCAASLAAHAAPAPGQDMSAAQSMPRQFEPPPGADAAGPPLRIALGYDSDLNADVSGGGRRGAAFLGKLSLIADADLDALIGLRGARAHASLLNIHGTGLSGQYVNNLNVASGIEAEPATRLNQLWVAFALPGQTRLRLGKFPAAQDFMASDTAAFFVNATFGWPTSFATDLPNGGPSWPLAAPGAMLQLSAGKRLTLKGAVFAGDPAGPGTGDPQRRDGNGFNAFGFAGRPLVMAEAAWRTRHGAALKLGGWVHFGRFDRIGPDGMDAGSVGGDWAVYALADVPLSGKLSGFLRATASPSDRNPVTVYLDAGLTVSAPLPGRPDDMIGLAIARSALSGRLSRTGLPSAESVVELSYSAVLGDHVSLQPNIQFIVHPVAPDFSGASGNALVLGLRSSLRF